jgi:C-terminal processing protease CtpA/Prc
MLPSLGEARAIILDVRGYPSTVASTILGHFIDRPIQSPLWHVPVLESGDYHRARWEIRPVRPRLRAHLLVLVDARAMSRAETVVQIVHDNRVATLIGEPSGGTNGNIAEAILPGGFIMHFTGMRVPLEDGTAIQGKGISPDHVVHPTLEGMRTGHDEILAAALALAEKLTSPKSP